MINDKKILSVVTARGGSKGIPFKNVVYLLDKPLFIWSVEASLKSKYVDLTVVSSNCEKVHKYFCIFKRKNNISDEKLKFIKRPDNISTDISINEDALIHSLSYLECMDYNDFNTVINLQPTSPVRLNGLIDKCIEKYENGSYDSLLTGQKITPFLWRKEDKWIYNVDKNDCCKRKMRQQFREDEFLWHDNGSVYIVNKDILIEKKCRIGYNPCVFETDDLNSFQIDNKFDFSIIENIIKVRRLNSLI